MAMIDYCTLWPDFIGLGNIYIGECCKIHDYNYAVGMDKLIADIELQRCVRSKNAPITSFIMLIGVTLFGGRFYRNAHRK